MARWPTLALLALTALPFAAGGALAATPEAEVDPREPARTALTRGRALADQGHTEAAAAQLRRALALYPAYPLAANELGALLARAGDLDGALTALQDAVRLDPDFGAAWSNLGEVHRRRGDHSDAVHAWGHALRVDEEDADAWYGLAAGLGALGRHAEMLGALERFVDLVDDSDERHAEAEAAITSLEEREVEPREPSLPSSAPAPVEEIVALPGLPAHVADGHYDAARYVAAAEAYRAALRDDPDDPVLRYKLAATLAVMRDMHGATREWARVLATDADRELVLRHVSQASQVLAERGHLEILLEEDEEEPLARTRTALLAGRPADALAALAEAEPGTERDWLTGEAMLRMGRHGEAIGAFERVLQANPEDRDALGGLAEAQLRLGRHEAAASPMALWLAGLNVPPESFVILRAQDAIVRLTHGPPPPATGEDGDGEGEDIDLD